MKIKSTIWATWQKYSKEWGYYLSDVDMSDSGWVKIKDIEIEFDSLADDELRHLMTKALRREQNKVRAQAEVNCQEIEETISSLLAIEDKSNEAGK